MTAANGEPAETPHNEGGHEAPPIEQMPAYGGYETPGSPPPPGYPQYQAPGGYPPVAPYGGYPPPAPGYYPGYPQAPAGTNSLAIFSLVASVIGLLCGVGSIIGIVLGAIALRQIKRTGQQGYGLAVAGIVVGVASLIISLVWITFATSH